MHLRGLELNFWHIEAIANCLKQAEGRCNQLKSVSFSYNSLGNAGVATLIKSLPSSVTEIGLVNCGISDTGGTEILDWMKNRQNIQMVCIEQNNYSTALRAVFQSFSNTHPDILFVF